MPTTMQAHGAFSWNELSTTDPRAARKFYGDLLGWTFRDMNMGDGDYTVVSANGQDVGGIMSMPPTAQKLPPFWGSYITVDNVDASAARATQLGGKVIVPLADVPTVGRFCVIQDPQGAMVALITYEKK
jgi:predicted enzyme related to lactoylglutathione lyase